MRTDSLPRDAEPPSHISDVADLEVTRDQLIYLRRAELTGRSDSRRRLLRSPRLRRFQCELVRRVTVAVFGVSVQQVHQNRSGASPSGGAPLSFVPGHRGARVPLGSRSPRSPEHESRAAP